MSRLMRRVGRSCVWSALMLVAFIIFIFTPAMTAAAKVHVVGFGKWTSVQWAPGTDDGKALAIKIRALLVDGRVKEYVLGAPHEVTDRLFVVRRVFRLNDSLPEEASPRWQWQRGGWLT